MKNSSIVFCVLLITSMAHATPGDIIRSQSLAGQPFYGVRGLAMDWSTGLIWVAGPEYAYDNKFTTMNPETMATGTWLTAAQNNLYWVFDIGFGEVGGKKYLLMNDQDWVCATKLVDPANGAYSGYLPNYYGSAHNTSGCSVDWSNNYVYLSSTGDPDVVYYDGSSHHIFTSITGADNAGTAVGWEHLFILRREPYYTIEVYQLSGTFVESIPFTSWPSGNYVIGLSCGREDAVGYNETLFFCGYMTEEVHEIEVGDYTSGGSLTQSTWGSIKTIF